MQDRFARRGSYDQRMDIRHSLHIMRPTIALAAFALLAGCASSQPRFSCPFEDTGYGCKSTREIYELTNQAGVSDTRGAAPVALTTAPKARNGHRIGLEGSAMSLRAPVQQDAGAFTTPAALSLGPVTGPVPLPPPDASAVARLPAQVMRIWIAPWTDERGDLHRPSHIYTEIVARRWAVGGDVRANQGVQASFDPNGPMFPKTDFHEGN